MHRITAYIEFGLILVIIISIIYLPFLFILKKRGVSPVRQLAGLGLGCSLFLIFFAAFLFMPIDFSLNRHFSCNLIPLHFLLEEDSLRLFITEKIPNILLFIPLGFFLPLTLGKFRTFKQTTLSALGLTCCIEFSQYFIGRSADIDDVITNFIGSVIGYGIYKIAEKLLQQTVFWQKLLDNTLINTKNEVKK